MPTFRLTTRNGQTASIAAARVVVSDDDVRFQMRQGGSWTQVSSAPLADIVSVERRLTEYDGRRRFVPDRDVATAVAATFDRDLVAGVDRR